MCLVTLDEIMTLKVTLWFGETQRRQVEKASVQIHPTLMSLFAHLAIIHLTNLYMWWNKHAAKVISPWIYHFISSKTAPTHSWEGKSTLALYPTLSFHEKHLTTGFTEKHKCAWVHPNSQFIDLGEVFPFI